MARAGGDDWNRDRGGGRGAGSALGVVPVVIEVLSHGHQVVLVGQRTEDFFGGGEGGVGLVVVQVGRVRVVATHVVHAFYEHDRVGVGVGVDERGKNYSQQEKKETKKIGNLKNWEFEKLN